MKAQDYSYLPTKTTFRRTQRGLLVYLPPTDPHLGTTSTTTLRSGHQGKLAMKRKQQEKCPPINKRPQTSTTIFDLPVEIIQQICLFLPYTFDAIIFIIASRKFYDLLNSNYFWFLRRRTIHTGPRLDMKWVNGIGSHFLKAEALDLWIERELRETFDPRKDYLGLVLRAFYGRTGLEWKEKIPSRSQLYIWPNWQYFKGRERAEAKEKEKGSPRCQICCIRSTQKYRREFGRFMCMQCYTLNTIGISSVLYLSHLSY